MHYGHALHSCFDAVRHHPGKAALRMTEIGLGVVETASEVLSPGGVFMLIDGTAALVALGHDDPKKTLEPRSKAENTKAVHGQRKQSH
jgi:hypothetical protein|tara:strand:- start:819 stop:1082 length:264 start_codon:yes stop_codon:yes gene_type:complete